jgi:hypothetical protein
VRLTNGNTLISDQCNDRVIEVDHQTPANIVFTQGVRNVPGSGRDPDSENASPATMLGD